MTGSSPLLRARHRHDSGRVAFVELFFDLVFVFAVTQLSHSLIAHFSLHGLLETTLMLLAVWWVWMYTTWITNWLDPEKIPVRFMLLVLMLAGMVMSSSIPHAFNGAGLAFAGAYVFMQAGRTAFMLWALRGGGHAILHRNFLRILLWFLLSAPLWIAGGLAEGEARFLLWLAALAIDYAGPWARFHLPVLGRSDVSDWDVDGKHIAERCALFIIIALGESVLVTGATFSHLPWNAATIAAFTASFVGSLAMWWLYFDTSAEAGSRRITHASAPGAMARLVYTYIHLLLVAGIVVLAVADEFALTHPEGHSDGKVTLTVLGGTALYLAGNALFKWGVTGYLPRSTLLAIAVLALLAPVAHFLAPWLLMTLSSLLLVALAAWEHRTARWCPVIAELMMEEPRAEARNHE